MLNIKVLKPLNCWRIFLCLKKGGTLAILNMLVWRLQELLKK